MGSFRNMLSVFLLAVNCLSCAAMAGEQAKSKPNFGLLMLFNCSPNSSLTRYSTHSGRGYLRVLSVDERNYGGTVVFDMMKVLNCSNYKWMHSSFVDENGFKRRMALDVLEIQNICDRCKEPGARDCGPGLRGKKVVGDPCDQCRKSDGQCGPALRCKEVGIGCRYRCSECDFDLHIYCAVPAPKIDHPFYTKCSFQFLSSPPGDALPYCNACEKDVGGFVYHCAAYGYDLHPCCAKLPTVLNDGEVKLYLYSKVSSSCNRCGRKGRSWAYRSTCKKYNLHVACVREMVVDSCSHLHGGSNDTASASASQTALETRIPRLKDTVQASSSMGKDKVKKGCEKAGMALKVVVSAVFGDPTALIAGAIARLVS